MLSREVAAERSPVAGPVAAGAVAVGVALAGVAAAATAALLGEAAAVELVRTGVFSRACMGAGGVLVCLTSAFAGEGVTAPSTALTTELSTATPGRTPDKATCTARGTVGRTGSCQSPHANNTACAATDNVKAQRNEAGQAGAANGVVMAETADMRRQTDEGDMKTGGPKADDILPPSPRPIPLASAPHVDMVELPSPLLEHLRSAERWVVMTGAGISAESGIPTFRDAQSGLWERFDPHELATPEAFATHPARVWAWYHWRRQLIGSAHPNPGHLALAELARRVPAFTLITQNVDGLHQEAGCNDVVELHGNIRRNRCEHCQHSEAATMPGRSEDLSATAELPPPTCPSCQQGRLRPDVVWFGEHLPDHALAAAISATESATVFFSIGTSSLVYPAADLPLLAQRQGALIVEINPAPTPLSQLADYTLHGPAGVILPALAHAL